MGRKLGPIIERSTHLDPFNELERTIVIVESSFAILSSLIEYPNTIPDFLYSLYFENRTTAHASFVSYL